MFDQNGNRETDGGKGSTPRPTDKQKFDENYDKIFGKKPKEQSE